MTDWRRDASEIAYKAAMACDWRDPGALKRALFDAYPYGPRRYHPYKIWLKVCKEIRALAERGQLEYLTGIYGQKYHPLTGELIPCDHCKNKRFVETETGSIRCPMCYVQSVPAVAGEGESNG